jgi:hypothetical protein
MKKLGRIIVTQQMNTDDIKQAVAEKFGHKVTEFLGKGSNIQRSAKTRQSLQLLVFAAHGNLRLRKCEATPSGELKLKTGKMRLLRHVWDSI